MRQFIPLIWLCITAFASSNFTFAQEEDPVVFVRTDLTDNIATLKGVGGTIAVVHGVRWLVSHR